MAMARTDPCGVPLIGFSASPMGRGMYEKFGFKVVGWFDFDVEDYESDEAAAAGVGMGGTLVRHKHRWPYMANFWEGVEGSRMEELSRVEAHEGPYDTAM